MKVKTAAGENFRLSDEVLGKCMQAFYGGRSEIHGRHQEFPIVVCDITSEYPSVAILLGIWRLLTAKRLWKLWSVQRKRSQLFDRVTLETTLSIRPHGQNLHSSPDRAEERYLLPIRSLYGESGNTSIGLNFPKLRCADLLHPGPDLAASKLKTGRTPKIVEAFKLVPRGTQNGMKAIAIGRRIFHPGKGDFFQAIIEERKGLHKNHPHYLLLKIIANALYGIFAELNKDEFGKNSAKTLEIFSGAHKFEQLSTVIEEPGRWHFPPAAALITAGGRLMLAILECLAEKKSGTYLLTDTDSMFFVASKTGGLIPCPGGPSRMPDGAPAVYAITWNQVEDICAKLNRLNPYDNSVVGQILKIEDCNYDRFGRQHQLYCFAISAKRYCVYKRLSRKLQIIKPSEHGLGFLYVPDRRKRYVPEDCKDQDSSYPRWVAEAWDRMLADYFRTSRDPGNALVEGGLWFEDIPAVMRVRVTTPSVLRALRKRDPEAAKPYNFALLPILIEAPSNCTLIAPFNKDPETWTTQEYTEIHSGKAVRLFKRFKGKELVPQTLRGVLWRHFLHPEDKSLAPDGQRCNPYTRGLLIRRPIQAMNPFQFIGKEIERKAQEGEDISVVESSGPMMYQADRTRNTHAADPGLIVRAKRFGLRELSRASEISQHAVERFLDGDRVHPKTRAAMMKAVLKLERAKVNLRR